MSPQRMARGLRALAVLALLSLAACDIGQETPTQILARQQAVDPPQLWLVQVVGATGAVKGSVFVCADTSLRDSFGRARAEVNGQLCRDTTSPFVKPNGWSLSCVAGGRPFAVSTASIGDPQRDFRVDFALSSLDIFNPGPDREHLTVRQSRHFRRFGECPAGWRVGDQARPGEHPVRS
jgi:hypothetical protein